MTCRCTHVALLKPTYSFPASLFMKFMTCKRERVRRSRITSRPPTHETSGGGGRAAEPTSVRTRSYSHSRTSRRCWPLAETQRRQLGFQRSGVAQTPTSPTHDISTTTYDPHLYEIKLWQENSVSSQHYRSDQLVGYVTSQ